jgi:hypothetical protein
MFDQTQRDPPRTDTTTQRVPTVGPRPVAGPADATQTAPSPSPLPPAQVLGHYAEPAPADVGAVGPNGKVFERQAQAGASYGPGYTPTSAQQRHMGSGLSDQRLVDMDENFAGGVNDISKVEYDDGMKGVFKAESDENFVRKAMDAGIPENDPRWGNREVGALALDRAMGLGMVPHTEFATHGGYFGTVQEFVQGKTPAQIQEEDPELWARIQSDPRFQSQRADLQAFDYITGNMDRHGNNMMIQTGEGGDFQKIHAIDNGISFAPKTDLPVDGTHIHGLPEKYNRDTVAKIEALTPEIMRRQLEGLLSPEEIDAAIERRNALLTDVKAKGEDAFVDDWTAEVARRTAAAGAQAQASETEVEPRTTEADADRTQAEPARSVEDLDKTVQDSDTTAQDPDRTVTDPDRTQTGNPLARTVSAVRGLLATPPPASTDATTQKTEKTPV